MKVCLLGGYGTIQDAPYKDDSFEFWGLAQCVERYSRVTRLFEMHEPSTWKRFPMYSGRTVLLARLNYRDVPVVMRVPDPDVRHAEQYPFDEIAARFGPSCLNFDPHYYESSFAYMMAYAIWKGATEIHVYGVQLVGDEEWAYQRPNFHYWAGLAVGAGVKLWIHPDAPICRAGHTYGTPDWFDAGGAEGALARYNVKRIA